MGYLSIMKKGTRRGRAAGAGGSGRAHRRGLHDLRGGMHRGVVQDIYRRVTQCL